MTALELADADLHSPVVDAAMSTAAVMLGVEVVFLGGVDADDFTFLRLHGSVPGLVEGASSLLSDTPCEQMLAGGTAATSDLRGEPGLRDLAVVTEVGITSYVGVPLRVGGRVVGTLCGVDRSSVDLPDNAVELLTAIAGVLEAHVEATALRTVVQRSATGWRVGRADDLDLTSAMTLADLLAEDIGSPARPPRAGDGELTETDRLRLAVTQLEHALSARVTVEQAIGVLTERQQLTPRAAFERLRKASRNRGRKVHDLAREVVASAGEPGVPLPPELAGRR